MFIVERAERFKGPSRRMFRELSTKTEFKCRTIKVNSAQRGTVRVLQLLVMS